MSIKIKGADRLLKRLADAPKEARKAQRKATTVAGRAMAAELRPYVPVDEGILRKATSFKTFGKGDSMTAIAGADLKKLTPDKSRPSNVDYLVEFGHVSPNGIFIAPRPYLRNHAAAINQAGLSAYISALSAAVKAAI